MADDDRTMIKRLIDLLELPVDGTADQNDSLSDVVESARLVGVAIGIIMERRQLAEAQAFDLLVETSRATDVTVRQAAFDLIETGFVGRPPSRVVADTEPGPSGEARSPS